MKAISLWQPWATAIALGSKRVETRSWPTRHRGPLAIHAAKRKSEILLCMTRLPFQGALFPMVGKELPLGAIVAVAELVDCRPTHTFGDEIDQWRYAEDPAPSAYRWTERQMGDFSAGRYGWVLENIQALDEPVPCRGRQGLFEVEVST